MRIVPRPLAGLPGPELPGCQPAGLPGPELPDCQPAAPTLPRATELILEVLEAKKRNPSRWMRGTLRGLRYLEIFRLGPKKRALYLAFRNQVLRRTQRDPTRRDIDPSQVGIRDRDTCKLQIRDRHTSQLEIGDRGTAKLEIGTLEIAYKLEVWVPMANAADASKLEIPPERGGSSRRHGHLRAHLRAWL